MDCPAQQKKKDNVRTKSQHALLKFVCTSVASSYNKPLFAFDMQCPMASGYALGGETLCQITEIS